MLRKSEKNESLWIDRLMTAIGWVAVALGIAAVILLYKTSRSLWLDEGFLAYSLSKRSLMEMASRILDIDQIAPILYLYVVKIITLLFGNSEFTLRIFSFVSYLGMLSCAYYLLSRVYKISWPILGVGFIATMRVLLYYANEFKPYMSDCFFILLVLVLYDLYKRERLRFEVLTAVSMVLVWASSPVIFFLGAIYIYELISSLKQKDTVGIRRTAVDGGLVLLSFLVNYWYWLRPVAQSEFMIGYWEDSVFPLFIRSFEDIKMIVHLLLGFSSTFSYSSALLFALGAVGAIASTIKKESTTGVILLGILLTLVASAIGKYPFNTRLVLFLYPLLGILVFLGLEALINNLKGARRSIIVVLVAIIMISNYSSLEFLNQEARYRRHYEINNLVTYVQQEIQKDEKLFVYAPTMSAFLYRNGYEEKHIGDGISPDLDNVIIGEHWELLGEEGDEEIRSLLEEERLYLLFSMNRGEDMNHLLRAVGDAGYLELVRKDTGTPLYYCSHSVEDVKSRPGLRLVKQNVNEDGVSLTFEISAGPEAYLKHELGQMIHIVAKEAPELEFKIESKQIAPGALREKTVRFSWPENLDLLSFNLRSESFWFDELGTETVVVTRESLFEDR